MWSSVSLPLLSQCPHHSLVWTQDPIPVHVLPTLHCKPQQVIAILSSSTCLARSIMYNILIPSTSLYIIIISQKALSLCIRPILPSLQNTAIAHAKLADVLDPVMELYEDVKRKCLMRLEYENLMKSEAITSPTSKFYQKPLDYAMWKYAYYVCHKCNKVKLTFFANLLLPYPPSPFLYF